MPKTMISKALVGVGGLLALLVVLALLEGFHTIWFILKLAVPVYIGFVIGRMVGRTWPKTL